MPTHLRSIGTFLLGAILFGISYSQAPLYYSNQNQYFLQGLAKSGVGFLHEDWLVNTKDPTPLFSTIAWLTHDYLHEYLFYVYYLLIFGLYFYSLVGIYGYLRGGQESALERLLFITLFVGIHAALMRLASAHLLGIDYPWYLQAGLAGQYVLGFALQPSVFGVLLLASIHSFVRGHPWRAMTWACVGAIIHTTYLLAAALLTIAYMICTMRRDADPLFATRLRRALLLGAYALALVLPIVIYNLVTFAPTSAEEFAEGQRILAQVRIPHHAVFERWLDPVAWVQIGGMILAIFLVWQTPLFTIMGVTFVGSLLLSLVQYATRSDTLALLFPWRTSAILVPLATTVILTRFVSLFRARFATSTGAILKPVCLLLLMIFFAVGLAVPIFELGYRTNPAELPLLDYVKSHRQGGEVYLIPVEIPKAPPSTKVILAYSTNFTPAPRAGTAGHLIAIDLQRFRINAGAPIYVDFKSIPYKDVEVLEWYRRAQWAQGMYKDRDWNRPGVHKQLMDEKVTHVVTTTDRPITSDALELTDFTDENYRLYRVRPLK